jgi:hypothetical protein
MGQTDSHVNAEVRAVLVPLAKLAERHGVAVLCISHLTKRSQGLKAVYRSQGSLAFLAAARAAWAVALDPDDESRRLFLPVKCNLAQTTGLAYTIDEAGKLVWEPDPVLVRIDDLGDGDETPRDEAKAWLQTVLRDGPVEAKKLLRQAKADGVSEKTLRRAKKELGVFSDQRQSGWAWMLPDDTSKGDGQHGCYRV